MTEAPTEVWLRPGPTWDSYATTAFPDQPDAVRYVRAGHEMGRERAMSEAPVELWVSPGEGEYAGLWVEDGPGVLDEVRYVRADLHEAALALAERRVKTLVERLTPQVFSGEAS